MIRAIDRPGVVKRFYRKAATKSVDGGFAVVLDDRPVQTPGKAPLVLPCAALAEAIAAEWQSQDGRIVPATMPLMRLASTAIDRVAGRREMVIDDVSAHGASDLVCYRADEPAELVARQEAAWRPLLDWLERRYGARLAVTQGIVHVAQPPAALADLRTAVAALDDFMLIALHAATVAAGSLAIGLAIVEGELDAAAAFRASQVDETFQIEKWGADSEAAERRAALAAELAAAARMIDLLRS